MSEGNQVRCPECRTTQSAGAPFCENCGYRIRHVETVPESPALSDEVLARARRKASAARPRRTSGAQRASGRAASGVAPADSPPGAEGPRTYIEGLRAVDGAPGSEGVESGAASPSRGARHSDPGVGGGADGAAAERPGAFGAPEGAGGGFSGAAQPAVLSRSRLPIYMALWLSLSVVAVLGTYVWATRGADEPGRAGVAADIGGRVEVPAGSFMRGLDETVRSFIMQMCQRVDESPGENCAHQKLFKGEYPQESVELGAYRIDAGEVTVGAYQRCVEQGACGEIDYKSCEVWTHLGLQVALRVPRALQRPEVAVSCVDLGQARDYCAFAGGQLPSADQWEKAARGSDGRLFPWGNVWASDLANWAERDLIHSPIVGRLDGFARVAPPGSFPAGQSPFGAYDMAGNVAEWVAPKESSGAGVASARGGAWTSSPFDLRATGRIELGPEARRTDVGFRCVYP